MSTPESKPPTPPDSDTAANSSEETSEQLTAKTGPGTQAEQVIEAIRTVFDPEIPVNIYELGLVYSVDIDEKGTANIRMTLTSPACPSAAEIPVDVERKAMGVPGIKEAKVEVVWEPTWTPEMMSEAAKLQLGM
jgi:FeS assembly SUF system protein